VLEDANFIQDVSHRELTMVYTEAPKKQAGQQTMKKQPERQTIPAEAKKKAT